MQLIDFDPFASPDTSPEPGKVVPFAQPRTKKMEEPPAVREVPNNPQAEAGLIACCLIEPQEYIPTATERGVCEESFYLHTHAVIWAGLRELYAAGTPVGTLPLMVHLHGAGLLARAGGAAFIESVANSIQTTAHFHAFLQSVVESWIARRVQRQIALLSESLFRGIDPKQVETSLQSITQDLSRVVDEREQGRALADFTYPVDDPNVLLGTRYRWISRGGQLLIVGFSGSGKSSTCYQSATHWGIGRDFLGINCVRPLKVLIVQAEDDAGDIGEVVESVKQGCNLTQEEMELFRKNVIVRTHKTSAGEAFLWWLGNQCRKLQPDLVYINPLFNYISGSVSDDDVCNEFYNGLNRINPEDRWAYVIFHHTPKPPREEAQGSRPSLNKQYGGHGSAVLTNRPRATIIIEPDAENDRAFTWVLAKRGRRAGIVAHVPHGAVTREEIVTKIYAKHTNRRIKVGDVSYPMILWELDPDRSAAKPAPVTEKRARDESATMLERDLLKVIPVGKANARPPGHLFRDARSAHMMVTQEKFYKIILGLRSKGQVAYDEKAGYWRPHFDDGPPTLNPDPEPLARHVDIEPDNDQSPFG